MTASSDPNAFAATISEIGERNLLAALAQRMDESVDRLPVSNAAILLPAMFAIGQKLAVTRTADPFNSPWVSAWRAVSWFLRNIPASERGHLAVEALKSSGALSMGAIIIHLSDPDDAKENDRENFDPTLDIDGVNAMKAEWLRQISNLAADPDAMLAHGDLTSLLYRWRDYTRTPDLPAKWVQQVVSTDARFAVLIDRLMSRGRSSGWGDRVSAPYDSFSKETIEELFGLETARERASAIELDGLPQDQAHAMRTLLRFLDGWRDGNERV
ncbi:hypothetical protein [Sphingobium sp. AntQ-1]|uniref:hypothetical protein n=1 Tax=Sphingobium sp. AntQ-1 TaxID=2930091 RepID=UPI00234EC790|nr:hypothetical protein [Sphingobium sp. AntQ-1]